MGLFRDSVTPFSTFALHLSGGKGKKIQFIHCGEQEPEFWTFKQLFHTMISDGTLSIKEMLYNWINIQYNIQSMKRAHNDERKLNSVSMSHHWSIALEWHG